MTTSMEGSNESSQMESNDSNAARSNRGPRISQEESGALARLFDLRKRQQPPTKSSWEREMQRGMVHEFGEYKVSMQTAGGSKEEVIIKEDVAMIATRVWDCSVMTSKWLEHKSRTEQGEIDLRLALNIPVIDNRPLQVLELGSGTGLLTVCMAKMGAAVMSTEYGPVVRYLAENCQQNGVLLDTRTTGKTMVAGLAHCRELDWYKASETLETLFAPGETAIFDVIIVTDCSLTERDTEGIFDMFHKYATKGHTRIVAGVCREREGTPLFVDMATKGDFSNVVEVPMSDQHPDYRTKRHTILLFDA